MGDIPWSNGLGTGVWGSGGNWVGGVKPGPGDVALLNNTSDTDCVMDEPPNVGGIVMAATYGHTLTQAGVFPMAVGNGGFLQSGGIFQGGLGAWSLAGDMIITGGVWNGNSAIINVSSNAGPVEISVGGTGVFNADFTEFMLGGANIITMPATQAFYDVGLYPNARVEFGAGQTVTMHRIRRSGPMVSRAFLDSTVPGTAWNLVLTGSSGLLDGVSVRDSHANGGIWVDAIGAEDRGNNEHWRFGAAAVIQHSIIHTLLKQTLLRRHHA